MPIALTDSQLDIVLRCAEPLPPQDRDRYLNRVASLLRGVEIGDGAVARACQAAQPELFKAPDLAGGVGEAKPLRKFQQQRRAPSAA